jgi:AcrR family transcriptional regulator
MSTSRTGGRSARVREAVFEAASALLLERGLGGVSMPDVAQRAGVAATSLYRRWGGVTELLMDLAVERLERESPLPDTGSLAGDLSVWGRGVARIMRSPEGSAFFRVLVATAPASGSDAAARSGALYRRFGEIEAMLDRARARGEAVPTGWDIIDHLLAPLYVRTLVGAPPDEVFAQALVDRLLADVAARDR